MPTLKPPPEPNRDYSACRLPAERPDAEPRNGTDRERLFIISVLFRKPGGERRSEIDTFPVWCYGFAAFPAEPRCPGPGAPRCAGRGDGSGANPGAAGRLQILRPDQGGSPGGINAARRGKQTLPMASFLDFLRRPPSLKDLPILPYHVRFSLDRLSIGVDNVRHDVQVSPRLRQAADRAAFLLMVRHTGIEEMVRAGGPPEWKKAREVFQDRCRRVLTAAVHKAKSKREIQIDYLAQAAVAKLILQSTEKQFERVLQTLEQHLSGYELSLHQDLSATVAIKEKLTWIRQHRAEMIRSAAGDLFQEAVDSGKDVDTLREANFGSDALLPGDFFSNPMLHADALRDDAFLLENYTLLSHRFEDPDSYERLMALLSDFILRIDRDRHPAAVDEEPEEASRTDPTRYWMVVENVDALFDARLTADQLNELPPGREMRAERRRLRQQRRSQHRLLGKMYRTFQRAGLLYRVCAGFEVPALCERFCPPLVPQQILRYLVEPSSRRRTIAQLNRLKGYYGRSFSPALLNRAVRQARALPRAKKRERLLLFLRALARYHRDASHYRQARGAMDSIAIDPDERTLQLSRENRTLYDFLLPDEQGKEDQPVIGHVIIKADVRGSTDLTYRMKGHQLNPASFFSLNLFDPITEILFDYDAAKEFIEGDALILSIFEKQETPEGWYSVSRACGLAVRMLQIVAHSNIKSRKHQLPVLELGIGICYDASPPAFLFDAGNRIMISTAINRADRLSGCHKRLRKLIEKRKLPFNLYVFQTVSEKERDKTADDLFFRYNVNGIELNAEGFEKLSREINLVELSFSDAAEEQQAAHRFHAGRVPLVHGRYQTLVIREAPVFNVEADSLRVLSKSPHRYYEVCTHPRLYQKAETLFGNEPEA